MLILSQITSYYRQCRLNFVFVDGHQLRSQWIVISALPGLNLKFIDEHQLMYISIFTVIVAIAYIDGSSKCCYGDV